MKLVVAVAAVSALTLTGAAWPQTRNEGPLVLACLSSPETRDLFVADKLVPPFRIMREASRELQAEAIDIQLCRARGALVYDVTLLDRDGRIVHRLVTASNGTAFNGLEPP